MIRLRSILEETGCLDVPEKTSLYKDLLIPAGFSISLAHRILLTGSKELSFSIDFQQQQFSPFNLYYIPSGHLLHLPIQVNSGIMLNIPDVAPDNTIFSILLRIGFKPCKQLLNPAIKTGLADRYKQISSLPASRSGTKLAISYMLETIQHYALRIPGPAHTAAYLQYNQACRLIKLIHESNIQLKEWDIATIGDALQLNPYAIRKLCISSFGLNFKSIVKYYFNIKIRFFLWHFRHLSLQDIGAELGFYESSYFHRYIRKSYGLSASRVQQDVFDMIHPDIYSRKEETD